MAGFVRAIVIVILLKANVDKLIYKLDFIDLSNNRKNLRSKCFSSVTLMDKTYAV